MGRTIYTAVFDVDGTLVDSVDAHAQAWLEAFQEFGKDIAFSAIRQQIGKGGDHLLPVFLSAEEVQKLGNRIEEKRGQIFKKKHLRALRGFPKTRELFLRLREAKIQIALASSAKSDELEIYKEIAQISDLIDEAASKDDAAHSKPDPDIFAAALERLGNVNPENALAIGDTPYDAEAAGKLGLKTIGLRCGGFPEEQLRAAGCIEIYEDPADLLERFTSSALFTRRN